VAATLFKDVKLMAETVIKNATFCRINHIKTDGGKIDDREMSGSRKNELEKVELLRAFYTSVEQRDPSGASYQYKKKALLVFWAVFKPSEPHNYEMTAKSSPSGNGKQAKCPECGGDVFFFDHERGEQICASCGLVISEVEMVPQRNHDVKLQSYLSLTALNKGTLPPEGKEKTELDASNHIDKYCFMLGFPKHIIEQAVVHMQKIFRASRGSTHRVTKKEAAIVAIICACRDAKHPYSIRSIAAKLNMNENDIYKLLARVSNFYKIPPRIVPPESYISFITSKVSGELKPHYQTIVERSALRVVKKARNVSSNPLYLAAAAVIAVDERMQRKIGLQKIARAINAGLNGSLRKLVTCLKAVPYRKPVGSLQYFADLRRELRK